MTARRYLGIECPFCGAEFHQTVEAADIIAMGYRNWRTTR